MRSAKKRSDFEQLITEARNPLTLSIDRMTTAQILRSINREDRCVPRAVQSQILQIAGVVDALVERLKAGGRLFYVGAGTSGRLGVLDAAECPPTFGTSPSVVQAIIAGGRRAVWRSVEGAEDNEREAVAKVRNKGIGSCDVVVGLAACGQTPFVLAALREGKRRGAFTVALSCAKNELLSRYANVSVTPVVGPEVLAGSTRLKAGTAEKLVLNMISTAAMVRLGKVYSNLMIDLKPKSRKLWDRAERIVSLLTNKSRKSVRKALKVAKGDLKAAIVMLNSGVSYAVALKLLGSAGGHVWKAIGLSEHANVARKFGPE